MAISWWIGISRLHEWPWKDDKEYERVKVLHYEHLGVGVILSEALQKLGIESSVLAAAPHPFGFKEDFLLPAHKGPFGKVYRFLEWRKFHNFDILHSHLSGRLPSLITEHWRDAFIQHYHDPMTRVRFYDRDVPSFVSLPNILKVIPEATWIPIPVHTDLFTPEKRLPHREVHIGYYGLKPPSDPVKAKYIPEREIEIAIEELRGKAVPYPISEIIPYQRIAEYYGSIDVWVDRIGLNFYGFSAVEVAAMGIPVITQIGEDEASMVPNCPFISINRDEVTEAIITLVEDEQLRKTLGERAREFIVQVHDSIKSAKLCLKQYQRMLNEM